MAHFAQNGDHAIDIERGATGKRILLTLLFAVVVRLLEVVLAVVVLFELAYSLITKRSPSGRVTRFAHRVLQYGYEIGEYVTCNRDHPPFPFDDLPNRLGSIGLNPNANL